MKQLRRVSPRIPYEETVCLTRVDGGGRLFGRSVNLGLAGMYVVCIEPCEIGTELVCSLLLPGGPRKLRARVTRLTALPRGVGIAVAFHSIKNHDRVVIESLIAAHKRDVQAAKLRLEGVEAPVPCEAVVEERTVHLTTALPFLRLDKGVEVVLGEHDEVETAGVISRIALDPAQPDGVPRLSLDVELRGPQATDAPEPSPRPPSALPEPCGHPMPTVVISKTLEREALARAAVGRPRPAHRSGVTAEIARPARFTDWTPPPTVSPRAGRTKQHPLGGWNRHPAAPARRPTTTTVSVRTLPPHPSNRGYLVLLLMLPAAAALAALLIRSLG